MVATAADSRRSQRPALSSMIFVGLLFLVGSPPVAKLWRVEARILVSEQQYQYQQQSLQQYQYPQQQQQQQSDNDWATASDLDFNCGDGEHISGRSILFSTQKVLSTYKNLKKLYHVNLSKVYDEKTIQTNPRFLAVR